MKKESLEDRILGFLSLCGEDEWVSRGVLETRARRGGYTTEEIEETIQKLEKSEPHLRMKRVGGIFYYSFVNISPELASDLKKDYEFFDSL